MWCKRPILKNKKIKIEKEKILSRKKNFSEKKEKLYIRACLRFTLYIVYFIYIVTYILYSNLYI